MMSMNPFYTSHRIGQLILKRSALPAKGAFLLSHGSRSRRIRRGDQGFRSNNHESSAHPHRGIR
ncbi:hypothetical protein DXU84_19670 [Rahnella sp. RcJ3]|nr:hypothetical protein [Rahnella sp. RcJ3]